MKWINVETKKPYCYKTGHWDGKQSDLFIGETKEGKKFLGCCYEGIMDGNYFFDWYMVDEINRNDYHINSEDIVRWAEINEI